MKGNRGSWYTPWVLLALAPLWVGAGMAAAQDDPVWPVESKLVRNFDDAVQTWVDVGDVSIWNTHTELKIDVVPYAGYRIEKVAIHIVDDPADFAAVLDKKGKPKVSLFTYSTDYLGDFHTTVASHRQVIDMGTLDVCWSVRPEICPPDRYILVAVDLQGIEERAYGSNGGVFDRYVPAHLGGLAWGFYVTYPLAKVEPGHFVDANVAGLTYRTVTQEGITGSEGQFWFLPLETIAFWVGDLYLGEAQADRAVTPQDLFPGADLEDDRVLNLARLLQSLDGDGNPGQGSINITEAVVACVDNALATLYPPFAGFDDDDSVDALIGATVAGCSVPLREVSKEEALENLGSGMKAGNVMRRNVSKSPDLASAKAQIEIMPVYVPAQTTDGIATEVVYYDEEGSVIETRSVAKPIVVSYLDEVEGALGAMDVYVAISLDDGDTWKRKNISRTADKSSLFGYPGKSWKPMLEVAGNLIFVAWTDKYCHGGRPGYAITVCPDTNGDGVADPCEICRTTAEGEICTTDYPGDDAYWRDDLFGVAGPQRSVLYEEYPEMGEVPYSCVWTARGMLDPATGDVQWFKPERVTSGRRDAFQLTSATADAVGIAIAWQEDPKGLMPGEGDGPGEGWSGANTHNKADVWFSYIKLSDLARIDLSYPSGGHGDGDPVDVDPELAGRVKALVPMSLPVKVSDNDICSLENMVPDGGHGEHDFDEEGQGTHRYCGTPEAIGTAESPGSNRLCAYTVERTNPVGELHHVCVTADGRLLDGNTGASRPNLNLLPFKDRSNAWVLVGYEESKGVGVPPEEDDPGCGDEDSDDVTVPEENPDDRYKPDMGKNIIYHSFKMFTPETVAAGGIVNLPETDENGNVVYVKNEDGSLFLDWKGDPVLAYENARRVRFVPQPPSKLTSGDMTSVAIIYRQGEEGSGKPADIFLRRALNVSAAAPYAYANIQPGAQNLSSVEPTLMFEDPFDSEAPVKMLRWGWSPANLADSSARNPFTDARAHRGALNGNDLLIAYTWTPNWGRRGNDKYDLYVRRSFDGGRSWTTDPTATEPIEHGVLYKLPVLDEENEEVIWDKEWVTTSYEPGELEPPRNVSNLQSNRLSVLEPRLVKTPGKISSSYNFPEDSQNSSIFQVAYGVEVNQNQSPVSVAYPKTPLDIYYGKTTDKGQSYETVLVTPQDGDGGPGEGWNLLAKDHPRQGAAQIRQTPDGSRMYGIWLEESAEGSDIMFRRVDYR